MKSLSFALSAVAILASLAMTPSPQGNAQQRWVPPPTLSPTQQETRREWRWKIMPVPS
jgi:hypothetical protein